MRDKFGFLRYNRKVINIYFWFYSNISEAIYMQFFLNSSAVALFATNVSTTTWIVIELVLAVILVALVFLFRQRLAKLICACGAETCLWLACDMAFPNSLLSTIMTWVTALATIVVVISIVNHIDWSNLRGKKH